MRWALFAVLTWIALGLELGLRDAMRLGPTPIAPSFVFALAAFVALGAPAATTLWTCLALGLVTDLTRSVEFTGGLPPATIVGPYAVGYLIAGQLVLALRGVMIRWNPLTLGFLAGLGYAVAQIIVVALTTLRVSLGDPIAWSATGELGWRMGSALYTGVAAVLLGFVLLPLAPLLGLHAPTQRRFGRR